MSQTGSKPAAQPPADRGDHAFRAAARWHKLDQPAARQELFAARARARAGAYACNIENYIGTVATPVGVTGPLKIHGSAGSASYTVPLATTEAALVASYSRGAGVISAAGGCTVRAVGEGVSRTPFFAFANLADAHDFARFVEGAREMIERQVPRVSSHCRLLDLASVIEGNHVYLRLTYATGDAAGQNMVTFVSDLVCRKLLEASTVQPEYWFLEANLSGDKKATAATLSSVRGRRVVAEVEIPESLVRERLHTSATRMVEYWRAGALGGVMSGTTGVQGHFANGLAALYLACGQDIACVAESATGVTRMQVRGDALYVSVTLPNLIVGTVGGGTGLPGPAACLQILGLQGKGKAQTFAEVAAATVLAGEISIIAAFCSGDFANAHRALSRGTAFQREGQDHV